MEALEPLCSMTICCAKMCTSSSILVAKSFTALCCQCFECICIRKKHQIAYDNAITCTCTSLNKQPHHLHVTVFTCDEERCYSIVSCSLVHICTSLNEQPHHL